MNGRIASLLLAATGLLVACAPTPQTQPLAESGTAPAAREASRTLVFAFKDEPIALVSALGLGSNLSHAVRIFTAGIALKDDRGTPRPYLAEVLPQLGTDTWLLFPDGRMETTYRLRPNLVWHDGAPLTAEDFVFSWRLHASPEFGVSGRPPQTHIDDATAPEPHTLVIRWRRPYPHADSLSTLNSFDIPPLPRDILASTSQTERPETLMNLPYWTREYLGAGPFRLVRWDPGAMIEAVAFDQHALGRPRIDRLQVRWIADAQAALANMLTGEIHFTDERALEFVQGMALRREWARNGGGTVITAPTLLRYAGIQFRSEVVNPAALGDLRVRRAIAHSVDRAAFMEGLFEGDGVPAESLIAPQLPYFADVNRAITKYHHDPRRAEQLMMEAGFARGADGSFAAPNGARLEFDNRVAGSNAEDEAAILADSLGRSGLFVKTTVFPTSLLLDGQFRSSYPALDSTGGGIEPHNITRSLTTAIIPRPENRWTGQNRGGWSNTTYDRLVEEFDTNLDRSQTTRLVAEMMKIVSDELPWIPYYFNLRVTAHVAGLRGVPTPGPLGTTNWNMHEWEFRWTGA